jgi:hypothetical protein
MIEFEIEPEEISLATEIFTVLRHITDQIKPRNSYKVFKALLLRLRTQPDQFESISADIQTMLLEAGTNTEALFEQFSTAYCDVIFDQEFAMSTRSIIPYLYLLPRFGSLSFSIVLGYDDPFFLTT